MDYFVVDIVSKKVFCHDITINDSLKDQLKNIKKIEIENNKKTGNKRVTFILNDNKSL